MSLDDDDDDPLTSLWMQDFQNLQNRLQALGFATIEDGQGGVILPPKAHAERKKPKRRQIKLPHDFVCLKKIRVRREPTTSSTSFWKLAKGTVVTATERNELWYKIDKGWVLSKVTTADDKEVQLLAPHSKSKIEREKEETARRKLAAEKKAGRDRPFKGLNLFKKKATFQIGDLVVVELPHGSNLWRPAYVAHILKDGKRFGVVSVQTKADGTRGRVVVGEDNIKLLKRNPKNQKKVPEGGKSRPEQKKQPSMDSIARFMRDMRELRTITEDEKMPDLDDDTLKALPDYSKRSMMLFQRMAGTTGKEVKDFLEQVQKKQDEARSRRQEIYDIMEQQKERYLSQISEVRDDIEDLQREPEMDDDTLREAFNEYAGQKGYLCDLDLCRMMEERGEYMSIQDARDVMREYNGSKAVRLTLNFDRFKELMNPQIDEDDI